MIDTSTAKSAVTLEDAKLHLRVDHSADDALIEALCLSATQMAEHELQRGLITREGTVGYGAEPCRNQALDSDSSRSLLRAS